MIDLILNEPQLLFSLALTAKTCLVTLALFLVAGPLAGYYLARAPGVAPRVLGFVITIPLVFPPVALGYMLLTALGRTSLVGGALEPFGLSLIFNETAVALAGFIAGLPLVVRPLQAAFASPRLIELEEAARIHGASRRDVFLRVTLPLVRPSLAAALLLGSAASRARWARQHLGAHQHALARNLQRRLTRRLRRRERALPPALALCGRHLPCGRAPHQAQPKALTSNARMTRETLRLDSSEMVDRLEWKDYPILFIYPP